MNLFNRSGSPRQTATMFQLRLIITYSCTAWRKVQHTFLEGAAMLYTPKQEEGGNQ